MIPVFRFPIIITALVLVLIKPLVAQDYNAGIAANKRGDYITALKHLRPLAEEGFPEAQALFGAMYAEGRGVPQDFTEAIKWFRKGVAQGNHWAQHNLGYMYAEGRGVPQNYIEAAKWFRKSANQGNADAQNNLGAMYETGTGVLQDRILAYVWYQIAVANGDKSAFSYNRDISEKTLTSAELIKAQAIARKCWNKPVTCPP